MFYLILFDSKKIFLEFNKNIGEKAHPQNLQPLQARIVLFPFKLEVFGSSELVPAVGDQRIDDLPAPVAEDGVRLERELFRLADGDPAGGLTGLL